MIKNKINGKIYIGQTIRPIEKRLGEHRLGESKGCRAIYNAIKFHGWDNFKKDWYECPDDDLNFYEEMLVALLGTLSPNGYNLREGGGATGKLSEESKQRHREVQLGKTPSEESKQKNREAHLGKTANKETKQKQRKAHLGENNHMWGKTHTQETKIKQSEAKKGEKCFWYGMTGDKHHGSKRVYQYDLEGTFINSFASCGDAGRHLEKKRGSVSISMCAADVSGCKTAYGFKWSYKKMS